jgi:hypothetical protein
MAPIKTLALTALLFNSILAAPLKVRQIAGEGQAADSILTDFDNGVGYGTESAEDNLAQLITNTKSGNTGSGGSSGGNPPPPPPPHKRQIAGEGQAADSILTDFDNGVGYGTESAEDNLAQLITNTKSGNTGSGGSSGGNPPPPPPHRRQLDKISAGFATLGDAAGVGAVADPVAAAGESADGTLTGAAAEAGAEIGQAEENILESAGESVPTQLRKIRRQLDKISAGFATLGDAAGVGAVADPVAAAGESADGTLTGDAANAGAQVGAAEVSILEGAGSSVPTHLKVR